MSSQLLYTYTNDEGTFGFFREGYDPGYWVCTRSNRPASSNIICSIQKGFALTKEAKAAGADPKVFMVPEKPKPISVGRGGGKKKSTGVKLFG